MADNQVHHHLVDTYFKKYPLEIADLLSSFEQERSLEYLKEQSVKTAGIVLSGMNPDIASNILENLDPEDFIALVEEQNVFFSARLIARFDPTIIDQRLELLSVGKAKQIRETISYPPDCAVL